ncbi:hypothetical protein [Kitasatospora viridis]|uniref:Uncharacterized protein n=1 Tax=Kitasatospora viridis TaxID=281105 RepID=A0A561SFX0_9ACTN|nr:hypothetical protein [Kitasatospora viridis]TWF73762.1 hypothetical protein FHX73_15389 [Kitasatospora viridis]
MPRSVLPTTQAAVAAVTATAERHGRSVTASHDIGADQTFAGLLATGSDDADPSAVPHEALLEFGGTPAVTVRLFTHDEARVTVEGVGFDVRREVLPDFLDAVWSGLAHVRVRTFPPAQTLKVAVPGEPTYREHVDLMTPWLWKVSR